MGAPIRVLVNPAKPFAERARRWQLPTRAAADAPDAPGLCAQPAQPTPILVTHTIQTATVDTCMDVQIAPPIGQPMLPFPFPHPTCLASAAARARETLASGMPLGTAQPAHPRLVIGWLVEMSTISAVEAWAAATAIWNSDARAGTLSPQTADKYARETEKFIRHAALNGHGDLDAATADVIDWIHSGIRAPGGGFGAASDGTIRLRRAAVGQLYATARRLGISDATPTLDIRLASGLKSSAWRPATSAEIDALRMQADLRHGSRAAVAFALAMCGAATGEIGLITWEGVDLAGRTLDLPGTSRTIPRRVHIHDDWAADVLGAHRAAVPPLPAMPEPPRGIPARLIRCRRSGVAAIQSSVCQTLGELIRATLRHHGRASNEQAGLTPAGIPAWAARQVFDQTRDITQVAAFLGVDSLDLAARTIRLDWQTSPTPAGIAATPGLAR